MMAKLAEFLLICAAIAVAPIAAPIIALWIAGGFYADWRDQHRHQPRGVFRWICSLAR